MAEAALLGKEAVLYEPQAGGKVRCTACARYCQIGEGQIGLCGIRGNVSGKLRLFVYGKIITAHVDPIEKKPVTHYRPGTKIMSVATTGCNWLCSYCQNFDISQRRKVEGMEVSPMGVVDLALKYGCQGIAYTYNQPSIFMEFAHDIGVEARKRGLINIFVSNGYDTPQTVGMMGDFLDCITVDFKGSGEQGFVRRYIGIPNADPIFQTLAEIKNKTNIHIEITDLIVPQVGDNLDAARRLCQWVKDNLGEETCTHFLRFHPDYRMMEFPPTPVETLEAHHRVGKEVGLKYVYIGNVPGHPLEHTYCAGCGKVVVERHGFDIVEWRLGVENRCPHCRTLLPIVGSPPPDHHRPRFISVKIQ